MVPGMVPGAAGEHSRESDEISRHWYNVEGWVARKGSVSLNSTSTNARSRSREMYGSVSSSVDTTFERRHLEEGKTIKYLKFGLPPESEEAIWGLSPGTASIHRSGGFKSARN